MVGDRKTPVHSYTVGALLLQAAVLLGYAAISYMDVQATSYQLTAGFANFGVAIFGGLGVMAIWLAGEHNSEHVRISRLQLWSIFLLFYHYSHSLYFLYR